MTHTTYPKALIKFENILDILSCDIDIVCNRINKKIVDFHDKPRSFDSTSVEEANQLFLLRDNLNKEYIFVLSHIDEEWGSLHELYMDDENPSAEQ